MKWKKEHKLPNTKTRLTDVTLTNPNIMHDMMGGQDMSDVTDLSTCSQGITDSYDDNPL